MVLAGSDKWKTWPYQCSLCLFMMVRKSLCGLIACWILELAFSKQVLSKDGFSPTGRRDQNKKFESSYLLQWWHNDVANTMKVSQLAYQLPSNRNLFSLAPGRSEHTTFVADFRGGTCNMDHLGHSESEAVALCSQSRYFSLTKPRFDVNRAVTSTKLSIKMLYF